MFAVMNRYFDSHAHLTDEALINTEAVLAACREAGVARVLDVAGDLEDSALCIGHAQEFDGVYAAVGVHPHAAQDLAVGPGMERLKVLCAQRGVVALGEMGLDYHYDRDWRDAQLNWFDAQMRLAAETGLPVVIHDREAHGDVLDMLKGYRGKVYGIVHCFSGSYEMAMECIKLGYYVSFSGSVTFKNARRLQEVAARLPLEHMLIETDAPYLSPEPVRNKRPNAPYNVVHVGACIAALKNLEPEAVAETTYRNACAVFGLPVDGAEEA